MEFCKYLALVAMGLTSACPAAAEISEGDYLVDLPLVAAATRLSQPVSESPASITIIDRDMILASGFLEIPDLLRLVPGFQVGLSWRDHHTAFAYHGQSDGLTRDMQILLDGRTAFGAQFGLADWDHLGITIDDLERIEVVRGPSGAAYGSNAFSGTINLVTRDTSTTPTWHLSAVSGSNDHGQLNGRYSYHGDSLDYRFAATYFETEGFDNINDQVDAISLNFKGRYQMRENQSLDLHLNYGGGDSGRGGLIPPFDPVGQKEMTESSVMLRWNIAQTSYDNLHVQFSHIRSREKDRYDIGLISELLGIAPDEVPAIANGLPDGVLEAAIYDFESQRLNLDIQKTQLFTGDARLVWGFGIQEDIVDGDMTFAPNPDDWEDVKGRIYGNLEKKLGKFSLNGGVLFEDGDLADGNLSSRFGLNYHFTANQTVRLSYAVGYRQPFIGEARHLIALYSNGVPVDTIIYTPQVPKPEKVEAYEAGYVALMPQHGLYLEAKLYREKYTDQIHQRIDPDFPDPIAFFPPGTLFRDNSGETTIDGFEFGLRWRISTTTDLWLSYAYANAEQFDQPGAIRSFLLYNGTPEHTGSLLISRKFKGDWQLSLGYYYFDDMSWHEPLGVSGNFVERYDRVDMRIAKRFKVSSGSLLVELIGQNLGDDYREFRPINQFTTRGFARVSLEFD